MWNVVYGDGNLYAGPFFSREAADEYRATLNRPERFSVLCQSGKYSEAYESILDLAASIVGGSPD